MIRKLHSWISFFLLIGMSFPILALAQNKDLSSSFEELRTHRTEIKTYLEALIQRDLASSLQWVMRKNGFRNEQIQEVLQGKVFQSFAQKIVSDPEIQTILDQGLEQVLQPGKLESSLRKLLQEKEDQKNQETLRILSELARIRNPNKSPKKSPTDFWNRFWMTWKEKLFD